MSEFLSSLLQGLGALFLYVSVCMALTKIIELMGENVGGREPYRPLWEEEIDFGFPGDLDRERDP